MKIEVTNDFKYHLEKQVRFISKDKPKAAKKFKSDLIKSLRKDLKSPFHFKKSIYFDTENIRDYVFKGYVCVYLIVTENQLVTIFGFIKYKESL
jgi:mRNA-degrading endonuclease RelE of RelBE toxin-antitoxin system